MTARITHVVESLARGGLERMVADLAVAQRETGHAVQVLCLYQRGVLAGEVEAGGVPVQACGKRAGPDFAALGRLRKALRAGRGGILHTHNAAAHYHAVLAAAGLGFSRVVNTRHGMGAGGAGARAEWLYRRAMRGTDAVAAVCRAARDAFDAQGVRPRGALLAVPNGIRLDGFASSTGERRRALARALGLGADALVVGSVGRLVPVKDHALLLDAFARVLAAEPRAALVLAGDGPARAALARQAQDLGIAARVRLLGDVDDVRTLLSGLSLFALSSRSEGYSIALLEACASGLPIVATDVGGNGEIVADRRNGLLVAHGRADAFGDALLGLLRDPPTARAMGDAGRRWAAGEASLDAMAARYARLYGLAA